MLGVFFGSVGFYYLIDPSVYREFRGFRTMCKGDSLFTVPMFMEYHAPEGLVFPAQAQANVELRDGSMNTPLMCAASHGHVEAWTELSFLKGFGRDEYLSCTIQSHEQDICIHI